MADLQNKISFDTAGAVANVNALSAALAKYNAVAGKVASATKASSQGSAKVAQGFEKSASSAKSATKQIQQNAQAIQNVGKTTKAAGNQMILSWTSVARIFAIQTIHQGISKITSSLASSLKGAREYQKQLAEIQTIGPEFKKDFAGLDEQVKAFSRLTGFYLDESTAGLYQTLSNQVASTGDKFTFMGRAADLAIAGVASLDSTVNLLSSSINSYGKSSEEAGILSGKLFKTVELGRLRIDEIANSYGRVLGLSAQIGISFDEVNASMATLTRSGLDWSEAITLITNVSLKLAKPTKALQKIFDQIGVSGAEAGISAFGFQGLIKEIGKVSGTTATALGKVFGRVRAVRGASGLIGEAAQGYADSFKQIQEANEQTTFDAKKFIFETNAKQLELEFNDAAVALESFGSTANSALLSVISGLGGGAQAIKTLSTGVAASVLAFAALKITGTAAFRAIAAGAVSAKGAMLALIASPVALAVAVGAAAAVAVAAYARISSAAVKAAETMRDSHKDATEQTIRDTTNRVIAERTAFKELTSELQRGLTDRVKIQIESEQAQDKYVDGLKDLLGKSKDDKASNLFDKIVASAQKAVDAINKVKSAIAGVNANVEDFKFDRAQKRLNNNLKETFNRIRKSDNLRRKSQQALKKGNLEEAKFLQSRALQESKSALAAADKTTNASLVDKAEKSVVASMEAENKLLNAKLNIAKKVSSLANTDVRSAVRLNKEFRKTASRKLPPSDPRLTAIVGKDFDDDPREQSNRLLEADKIFSRGVAAEQDIARLSSTISRNAADSAISVAKIKEAFTPLRALQDTSLTGDAREEDFQRQIKNTESFANTLTNTISRITEAQKTGSISTKQYAKDFEFLFQLQKKIPEASLAGKFTGLDPKSEVQKLITDLKKGEEAGKKIQELTPAKEAKDIIREGVIRFKTEGVEEAKAAINAIQDKSVTVGVEEQGVSAVQTAIDSIQGKTVTVVVNYVTTGTPPTATAAAAPAADSTESYFGRLFRAQGGAARGHDKIPAMLSKGEFVVNARSTRNMFSQLVSANANSRYLGGSVNNTTNTSNNTFNITGSSAPQQTAREISKLLKRENRIRK